MISLPKASTQVLRIDHKLQKKELDLNLLQGTLKIALSLDNFRANREQEQKRIYQSFLKLNKRSFIARFCPKKMMM